MIDKFEKAFHSAILRLTFKNKIGRYCLLVPIGFFLIVAVVLNSGSISCQISLKVMFLLTSGDLNSLK